MPSESDSMLVLQAQTKLKKKGIVWKMTIGLNNDLDTCSEWKENQVLKLLQGSLTAQMDV